jgi:hypothetical protein
MTKTQWKKTLASLGIEQWMGGETPAGWLTILPNGADITPVPFVLIPDGTIMKTKTRLWEERLTLQWSTLHLVEGYHHPKGTSVYAMSRPPDEWWDTHELSSDGKYIKKGVE